MARPFFRYYGSKWRGAKHYGPPRRDLVIEPFAGSACYSTYWNHPNVSLYDLSEEVCAAWDWLINCSLDDMRAIPEEFHSNEEFFSLPPGPQLIVYSLVVFGDFNAKGGLPPKYFRLINEGSDGGAWDRQAAALRNLGREGSVRELNGGTIWGPILKNRIIEQKPLLKGWSIEQADYRAIPLREAHWHVDPPYQGAPGRKYPHNEIDFAALGDWCRNLPGAVDVCENEGADWLPFQPLYDTHSMGRANGEAGRTVEVVWVKNPLCEDLFG